MDIAQSDTAGPKLFMFVLGGRFRNANVELHDTRFAVGVTAKACYPELRRQWWGDPASLHLDAWGEVRRADGYEVALRRARRPGGGKLFFVNLGGYDSAHFGELHRDLLIVATDAKTAVSRAKAAVANWRQPHKDAVFEVERALDISQALAGCGWHLHLAAVTPPGATSDFAFTCRYVPIAAAS